MDIEEARAWLRGERCMKSCVMCGKSFAVDSMGRRGSDWIVSDRFCDLNCNLAHLDANENRSIWAVVEMDRHPRNASRRVRNIGDLFELHSALAELARVET